MTGYRRWKTGVQEVGRPFKEQVHAQLGVSEALRSRHQGAPEDCGGLPGARSPRSVHPVKSTYAQQCAKFLPSTAPCDPPSSLEK